ncbi:hypothetical protein QR680_004248 [Steinernema hermaphroditum]|uniref:IgGFc-binding protein N-terminal domain-containing protein n=1 Tax=Steinernema hermaphroditum TaxID=289476 RepID=A0AA39LTP6_9BILA|nr:hypothetical protein QR680_004248 [Steinernema hermaphroditum]
MKGKAVVLTAFIALLIQASFGLNLATQPDQPVVLFGGDQVRHATLNQPLCMFVDAANTVDVSAVSFQMHDRNGTTSDKIVLKTFLNTTKVDFYGSYCFPDTTESISFDYGGLFDNVPLSSYRWRSLVLFFISKQQVEGPCQGRGTMGGNVHSATVRRSEKNVVSLHADCPAYFLVPTGIKTIVVSESNCPVFYIEQNIETITTLPDPIQIDINSVQTGVRPSQNLSILSFSGAEIPQLYNEQILRSAIEIRSNLSKWTEEAFHVEGQNGFHKSSQCTLDRDLNADDRSAYEGVVATDTQSPSDVYALVRFQDFKIPMVSFAVGDYDENCVDLTLSYTHRQHNNRTVISNPLGSFNYSNPLLTNFAVTIQRKNTTDCRLVNARISYSVVELWSPPVITTTPPPEMKGGGPLPFMVFAGDELTYIELDKPACMFVKAATEFEIRVLNFYAKNDNGSYIERVEATTFMQSHSPSDLFGVHCFDDLATTVIVEYGNIFHNVPVDSPLRRSAIFFFMEKDKFYGSCKDHGTKGGNVYAATMKQVVSLHADCPAIVLSPSGHDDLTGAWSNCPIVSLSNDSRKAYPQTLGSDVQINFTTIQSGIHPIKDLSLMSISGDRLPDVYGLDILRPAVMISTNSTEWLEDVLPVKAENTVILNQTEICSVVRVLSSESNVVLGILENDPWSPLQANHLIGPWPAKAHNQSVQVNFGPYDDNCFQVTLIYMEGVEMKKEINPHELLNITTEYPFTVEFNMTRQDGCEYSSMAAYYSVQKLSPSTAAATTTIPIQSTTKGGVEANTSVYKFFLVVFVVLCIRF